MIIDLAFLQISLIHWGEKKKKIKKILMALPYFYVNCLEKVYNAISILFKWSLQC